MSDIEPGLEDIRPTPDAPPAAREGLPSSYRMRADAHYVEQLDATPVVPSVRLVEASSIEVRGDAPRPTLAFIDSVKRHGVLQPLLVQMRGGRYRLIAGRKRLAAAVAAGLREVPCIVQRVDEEQAGLMAEATNVPAQEHAVPAAAVAGPAAPAPALPVSDGALDELARSLSALASSANLLSGGSSLTNVVAADLVKAEASRALQILLASRVLRDEVPVNRTKVPVKTIVDRAMQLTGAERRLRGTDVRLVLEGSRDAAVRGDEELLASAVAGLLMVTLGLVGERDGAARLTASAKSDGRVIFTASQESITVPEAWIARTFEAAWPLASAASSNFVLVKAAQRVAQLHGGQTSAASIESGTSLSMTLPVVPREM
jgi:ParB/RepB/Spo0J family partition protein